MLPDKKANAVRTVTEHRLTLITHVIRLLLTMVTQQRGDAIREPKEQYATHHPKIDIDELIASVPPLQ